jgi:hypothetical protein
MSFGKLAFGNLFFDYLLFSNLSFGNLVFDNMSFDNVMFDNVSFNNMLFDNVLFDNVSFDNVSFDNVSFDNVLFDNMLFGNLVFGNSFFDNVTFDSMLFGNLPLGNLFFDIAQMTAFISLLALNDAREKSARYDVLCCFKASKAQELAASKGSSLKTLFKTRAGICSVVERGLKIIKACSSKLCGSLSHVRTQERGNERKKESFVVTCIVFIYIKIFVCFILLVFLLLAARMRACASHVVYGNANSGINSLHHFSLYENICFVL